MKRRAEYVRLSSITRIRAATADLVISPAWVKTIKYLGRSEVLLSAPTKDAPISFYVRVALSADVLRMDVVRMLLLGETRDGYVQSVSIEPNTKILLLVEIKPGTMDPARPITP